MSGIMMPRPDNVRGRFGTYVDSDVYNIAQRLQEVSRRLMIATLDPPVSFAGKTYAFCVSEMCDDGVERFVKRYEQLDARVVTDCQYMLKVPFEKRFAEAEKLEAKRDAEQKEHELDELYERIGGPMLPLAERTGFIQRPISYAKRGRTAQRSRAARANA